MKTLVRSLAVFAFSTTLAFAQSGGSGGSGGGTASGGGGAASTGTSGSAPSGAGSSAVPGSAVFGPNNTGGTVPGLSTNQPSDNLPGGRAPGVNPANPQDATRRGNTSDRTLTGARNPQDMKAFDSGTPQIMAPERR